MNNYSALLYLNVLKNDIKRFKFFYFGAHGFFLVRKYFSFENNFKYNYFISPLTEMDLSENISES